MAWTLGNKKVRKSWGSINILKIIQLRGSMRHNQPAGCRKEAALQKRVSMPCGRKKEVERWNELSNEKNLWLVVLILGDEFLASYMGIIVNHYKDPY